MPGRGGQQPENGNTGEQQEISGISAGGLALVAGGHHPLGTILELKIDLPDAKGPITCLAKVMRVEELESNKAYMTTVCFLDLPSAQRVRLNKYIEEELE